MNREMVLEQVAFNLSAAAHKDKMYGDEPYINHPVRVAASLQKFEEKVVALLHDVLEDTDYVDLPFICHVFGYEIGLAVGEITREKYETYQEYIERLAGNKLATLVKIADLYENLSNNPKESLIRRYEEALVYLEKVVKSEGY